MTDIIQSSGNVFADLGLDQPKISTLVRGKLSGFTIDRLLRFLADLGCDVEISVRPAVEPGAQSAARAGRISVVA